MIVFVFGENDWLWISEPRNTYTYAQAIHDAADGEEGIQGGEDMCPGTTGDVMGWKKWGDLAAEREGCEDKYEVQSFFVFF
jgi:hypothetical protein